LKGCEPSGQESARVEHCMKCGSTEMRNHAYFCKGQKVRVYMQCARCGSYVARYTLFGYTSDEPYESLLQRMRFTRLASGKRTFKMVEAFGKDVQEEYEHVLELVRTGEDQRRIEQIIEQDYPDSLG
jgi:hypothetical protein